MAYLTKSRFKIGLECPSKLYYSSHPNEYPNSTEENPFLEALAKGGHQVGEMAKLHFPGGVEVKETTNQAAIERTQALIASGAKVLFEPAFLVGHRFIRVDILVLSEKYIELIEVKSKSMSGEGKEQFVSQRTQEANTKWRPYIEDLAFQMHLVKEVFAEDPRPVIASLMAPNKTKQTSIDGLYSLFPIKKSASGRHSSYAIPGTSLSDLGNSVLSKIDLTEHCLRLQSDQYYPQHRSYQGRNFLEIIDWFEHLLMNYEKGNEPTFFSVGKGCKNCEFRMDEATMGELKSGFHRCFKSAKNWSPEDFVAPKTWDLWNFRSATKLIDDEEKFLLSDLMEDDIYNEPLSEDSDVGMDADMRRWIQLINTVMNDGPHVHLNGLATLMGQCKAPYHFIDFETIAPAIPLYSSYKPYQGLCFQFSHHQMEDDGTYLHKTEYLGMGIEQNPSFEFVAKLYDALSQDEGTIFMYSHHENTYLNYMIELLDQKSPFDEAQTEKYINFLKSISKPSSSSKQSWAAGPRMMVDMAEIIKKCYWHPLMKGSNSIKVVLPAILNHSTFLQEKYSQNIYGKEGGIRSLNFREKAWLQYNDTGEIVDPYKMLPGLQELLPTSMENAERLFSDEHIGNGGAAMMAWAYMQFSEMKEEERAAIAKGLKMYCELDTLAMVMIWEGLREIVRTEYQPPRA